jgi:hypothetical protein
MSLCDEATGVRLIGTYCRTVGGIQLLYASFFGWVAYDSLWWSAYQMVRIAQEGFTFQGKTLKGTYIEPFHLGNFERGMEVALLSLCSLIGGYGLLRLRPWTRRWEIAYLTVVLVFSLRDLATEVRRGHDFGHLVLPTMALTLPYLPLLLISPPPHKPPSFGKANGAKPFVDDLTGI